MDRSTCEHFVPTGLPCEECDSETVVHELTIQEAEKLACYREALETLASNLNAAGTPPQPWADMIDSWHYIVRTALDA